MMSIISAVANVLPFYLAQDLANKKAGLGLLDLYSITHVTVVVDPIRAKSCRSLALPVLRSECNCTSR